MSRRTSLTAPLPILDELLPAHECTTCCYVFADLFQDLGAVIDLRPADRAVSFQGLSAPRKIFGKTTGRTRASSWWIMPMQ